MRIVIDTNIWISGLLWRGKPWQLLRLAESGKVELCIAYQMLLELDEVLAYPQFENRLALLETTPAQLAAFAMNISAAFEVSRTGLPIVQADPDDDVFLLCAAAAKAVYVVSNDSHLLRFKSYEGIEIVPIDTFLRREFDIK